MTQTRRSPATDLQCDRLFVVSVGKGRYGLPLDRVEEVLPLPSLIKPPVCPEILEGFLNLDGEAIPVVALDCLLRLSTSVRRLYTPLILVNGSGQRLALLADRVLGIVGISSEDAIFVPPGGSLNECAQGVAHFDDGPIVVLDVERLLLVEERLRVASLQELAEQRCKIWEGATE